VDAPGWLAPLARALDARLVETHISWVLLAPAVALKLKKPVRLPFVDYGTLEARRRFCEEEVRLNARLAPSLYLGVSRITRTARGVAVDGEGEVLEYAVRMRRFPDGALFSERAAAGLLGDGEIDALAQLLAGFHASTPAAPRDSGFGAPARRRDAALAVLEGAVAALGPGPAARLAKWLEGEAARLAPLWRCRAEAGRVRECHGDLHLANIVRLDGRVCAFDAIEFDPALRWIDVLDDVAFAVMDLAACGHRALAFRLLNGWLDATGEHEAVPGLRFSLVYRALVRAQVHTLQSGPSGARAQCYARSALEWSSPGPRQLTVMYGLPGSGKTFASQRLLQEQGAIRARSDVERKRLFGLGMLADTRAAGVQAYTGDVSRRTYDRLFDIAGEALAAGFPVILDAAFLQRAQRLRARQLAVRAGASFRIAVCDAPPEVLRQRLRERHGDASEADVAVLETLRAAAEPPGADELACGAAM